MMQGGGFEPPKAEPAGLQPAPFGHSGIPAGDAIVAASPAGQIYPPGGLAVVVPATLGAVVGRVRRRRGGRRLGRLGRRRRPLHELSGRRDDVPRLEEGLPLNVARLLVRRVAVERVPVVCDLRPAVRALDGAYLRRRETGAEGRLRAG